MSHMEFEDHFSILRSQNPDLAKELCGIRTLERVLDWLRTRGIHLGSLDMVSSATTCSFRLEPTGLRSE